VPGNDLSLRDLTLYPGKFQSLGFHCDALLMLSLCYTRRSLHYRVTVGFVVNFSVVPGRFHPFLQAKKAHRESRGIALLCFLDLGTRRGEGSASRPGRFLPSGKTRYPLYRRLGGPQGRYGQVRKISPPPGFDPRTVKPVASRYTD
jgi:hypothetical protein